ncbi:hypothetical protein FBY04_114107 [Pseudomonas sp. SJZ080]|uniref:hypothetical protein n=1 Tax=Pseudomonas sp. SJZ080 TaxID=2572888 RepID=UPI001199B71B|nr:hypothetical protein [Pseudomonas sp. SJZ080]TWC53075.1 hypothetical protein FBY04_114107 [Pseudomonas sp. SJZ080]
MRTLFKLWLGATIVSLTLYLPFYVFSNNAIDAVEELTPIDLIPLTGMKGQDPEQRENMLKRMGIDTSMELEDALDDNDRLSNVDIDYVDTDEARQVELSSGLKLVAATADIAGGKQLKIVFGVVPKRFLKSVAGVAGIVAFQITDGKHSLGIINGVSDELYLWTLFEPTGKAGVESVDRMVQMFDAHVARIEEDKRAREQDQAAQANAQRSTQAVDTQATAPQARQFESRTVAGNPSPEQVIIFQWEGQPAYCADEGADGANCHGDGSAFIGQGSHKDYMDSGSALCIAGEPDCKLPQYFPEDVRG